MIPILLTSLAYLLGGYAGIGACENTSGDYTDVTSFVSPSNSNLIRTYSYSCDTYEETSYIDYYILPRPSNYNDSLGWFEYDYYYDAGNDTYNYQYDFRMSKFDTSWKYSFDPQVPYNQFDNFSNIYIDFAFYGPYDIQFHYIGNLDNTYTYSTGGYQSLGNKELPSYAHDTFVVNVTFFVSNISYEGYYNLGVEDALNDNGYGWRLDNFLYSIVDIPVLYLKSFFDFELFGGVSIYGILLSLFTIAIAVFILRKMF